MVHADCLEALTHASWGYYQSKTSLRDDLVVELSVELSEYDVDGQKN